MRLVLSYKGYEIIQSGNGQYFVRKAAKFIADCFSIADGQKLINSLCGEW